MIASVLISDCSINKCNSFWIFCNSGVIAKECCVFLRWSRSILLVCVVPKWVCFLKGSRSLLWWFVCNLFWLLSGLPNGFWGLDVALGLRVNQYKLLVYLFLPLNPFKFSCYCFTAINIRLFRRNNRLFFWCFAVLYLNSWLTKILIWIHTEDFVQAEKVF